ncbi:MAG: hypothetical protein H7125_13470 [Proteobacteria bacterium]|nr:hypothetical protein [Burkholderiales bacterium]
MNTVAPFVARTITTGLLAAAASALAAAAGGRMFKGKALAPLNAVSHIAWGGTPPAHAGRGARNTLVGTALHTGAALFWAGGFEALFGRAARRSPASAVMGATTTSAVAFVTDYYLMSRRLQPGYEKYLSRRGLFAVYAALAVGMAAGAAVNRWNAEDVSDARGAR